MASANDLIFSTLLNCSLFLTYIGHAVILIYTIGFESSVTESERVLWASVRYSSPLKCWSLGNVAFKVAISVGMRSMLVPIEFSDAPVVDKWRSSHL